MSAPARLAMVAALAASLLAGCASDGPRARGHRLDLGGPRDRDRELETANPSAVIAAELAFARMAREEGTWTAFREYSTDDALWPAPALSNVRRDLAGAADPAEPIVWGPDAVWVSCDGSFALSTGPASYPNGRRSRFATIWQRQRNGDYRWVLDQGFDLETGYAEPEMIGARVADCPPRAPGMAAARGAPRRGLGQRPFDRRHARMVDRDRGRLQPDADRQDQPGRRDDRGVPPRIAAADGAGRAARADLPGLTCSSCSSRRSSPCSWCSTRPAARRSMPG